MKQRMMVQLFGLGLFLATPALADRHSFGFASDAGMRLPQQVMLRDALAAEGLTRLILPGDQLYNPRDSYENVWGHWNDFEFYITAHGNHWLSYEAEREYFGMPSEYYTKTIGDDIRFIVLNSDNEDGVDEQIAWYKDQLEKAQEPLLFVILHHPPYTISRYHNWEEKEDFQNGFRPLTMKHKDKIAAIFTGHDHFTSLYRINDLTWVHSGAALQHKSTYRMDEMVEPGIRLKTAWYYDETFHFTRLDIDTDKGLAQVSFVRTEDRRRSCIVTLRPQYATSAGCQD